MPQERPGDLCQARRRGKSGSSVPLYVRLARDVLAKRIFDDLRSIFGWSARSSTLTKYRACQQKQGFGYAHCMSSRLCNATSKNHGKRSRNCPPIVENRISELLGRSVRSTFGARGGSVEPCGATRGDSGRFGRPGDAARALGQARSRFARKRRQPDSLGNIVIDIYIYIYIYVYMYIYIYIYI